MQPHKVTPGSSSRSSASYMKQENPTFTSSSATEQTLRLNWANTGSGSRVRQSVLPPVCWSTQGRRSAHTVLEHTIAALGIPDGSRGSTLVPLVMDDLEAESLMAGMQDVYPPYLQMVLLWLFRSADSADLAVGYRQAGRARGIITDFLIDQLRFLGRREADGRAVLVALASAYGRKTQKATAEIAQEAGLELTRAADTLAALEDLRLVRSVYQRFEIVHDFLAGRIIELASADEKEGKQFRELLAIRSGSFANTRAVLTRVEHDFIYRHRRAFLISADEVQFLLVSHLTGNGPMRHWLRNYPRRDVLAWLYRIDDMVLADEEVDIAISARLRFTLGERLPLTSAAARLNNYAGRQTLVDLLPVLAGREDADLLIQLNRSRSSQLSRVAAEVFCNFFSASDLDLIDRMGRSSSYATHDLIRRLADKDTRKFTAAAGRELCDARSKGRALLGLHLIGKLGGEEDIAWLRGMLGRPRLAQVRRAAVRAALVAMASRLELHDEVRDLVFYEAGHAIGVQDPKDQLPRRQIDMSVVHAIAQPGPGYTTEDLLAWLNRPYPSEGQVDLARTAVRVAGSGDAEALRRAIQEARFMDDDARAELMLGLADLDPQGIFDFVLGTLMSSERDFDFTHASAVLASIARHARRRHLTGLKKLIGLKGFWETGGHALQARPHYP